MVHFSLLSNLFYIVHNHVVSTCGNKRPLFSLANAISYCIHLALSKYGTNRTFSFPGYNEYETHRES